MPARLRLDSAVAERGLARSRSAAAELIRAGRVRLNGEVVRRPSALVAADVRVEVEPDPYVSRAAHKLAGALHDLQLDVTGLRALDAGASTGGFTQVLLLAGCREVVAVDVGHDQLADAVRADPRVQVVERLNVRNLTREHVGSTPVDLVVADLSFISLTVVLPALTGVLDPAGSLLVMVKPQFEVGRERLGEGGVVRSPALHAAAVAGVVDAAADLGWYALQAVPSRLPGPAGNREFFLLFGTAPPAAPVVPAAQVGAGRRRLTTDRRPPPTPMLWQVTPPETAARRVAVLTHLGRREAVDTAARLIEKLAAAGITAVVPADDVAVLAERLTGAAVVGVTPEGFAEHAGDVELMLVLGGDGTILRGAALVITSDTPLLGVNLGHVGFLAEAESSEIDSIVDHVVQRTYTVEERFTVDVTLREGEEVIWSSFAVNEVSIEKAARERMLEISVEVDDRPLSRWACDGMLVATPTGSTAYAFSAGGPVLWPELDALLLVPLSAHALFARPLVLGPTSVITVQLGRTSPSHGVVWCDGSRSTELQVGMEIEVGRGQHRLRLARLSESPFSNRLVNKFQLPVDGWRGSAELRMRHSAGVEREPSHRRLPELGRPVSSGGAAG